MNESIEKSTMALFPIRNQYVRIENDMNNFGICNLFSLESKYRQAP
jgi:hypothetical protein